MINSSMFLRTLIRSYTFNSPVARGKYRLADIALRLSGKLPAEILVNTKDGRKVLISTRNASYRYMYFTGEYESAITKIFTQIIKPGDVCLDVGANIGWYTTLFQKLVGPTGKVHAFEPVKPIFDRLCKTQR